MSPGSVTARLHFYAAPYTSADRTGTGGGTEEDGEDLEVLELPFADALATVRDSHRRQDHPAPAMGRAGRRVRVRI